MALTLLVAYDITDNQRRAHVAATLQRWGDRLQRSVFVCTMEPTDLQGMLAAVNDELDPRTDSFMVFRQCATCWERLVVIGQAEPRKTHALPCCDVRPGGSTSNRLQGSRCARL